MRHRVAPTKSSAYLMKLKDFSFISQLTCIPRLSFKSMVLAYSMSVFSSPSRALFASNGENGGGTKRTSKSLDLCVSSFLSPNRTWDFHLIRLSIIATFFDQTKAFEHDIFDKEAEGSLPHLYLYICELLCGEGLAFLCCHRFHT